MPKPFKFYHHVSFPSHNIPKGSEVWFQSTRFLGTGRNCPKWGLGKTNLRDIEIGAMKSTSRGRKKGRSKGIWVIFSIDTNSRSQALLFQLQGLSDLFRTQSHLEGEAQDRQIDPELKLQAWLQAESLHSTTLPGWCSLRARYNR